MAWPRHERRPVPDRFWEKVDKTGGIDACWPWTAQQNTKGYGRFAIEAGWTVSAHRYAYELYYGVAPGEQLVCHWCDNPICVNPAHLWLGDAASNMQDMELKGRARHPKGENAGRALLDEAAVVKIFERRSAGEAVVHIARSFGVGHTTIHHVLQRTSWQHVSVPSALVESCQALMSRRRLSADRVRLVRELAQSGVRNHVIAELLDLNRSTVTKILDGRSYREVA